MNTLNTREPLTFHTLTQDWLQLLRVRTGRFKRINGKSLLVCIGAQPSPWLQDFLSAFAVTNPRENVLFLATTHTGRCEITNNARLPYPVQSFGLAARYLRKLRTGVVMVDEGATPPVQFLDSARKDTIAVVHVGCRGTSDASEIDIQDLSSQKAITAARQLSPLMAQEREPHIKLKNRIRFFFWKHVFYNFHRGSLRRVSSFDEIFRCLAQPESILCLGNGPSSEDPAIAEREYNSVFRVNHRWLKRGCYIHADAVFTGSVESVINVGTDSLYVFINAERAMRIVMRARKQIPYLRFTNALELGFPLDDFYPYQPTNGLIMVYIAVSLKPAVLTIAGIDLFRDPRGAYPGETKTANCYTSYHAVGREIRLLMKLLASYRGELRIIGDELASEYTRYISEEQYRQ